eukprot:scaffold100695_cov32-Tisochrysis_lutea.AAC.1
MMIVVLTGTVTVEKTIDESRQAGVSVQYCLTSRALSSFTKAPHDLSISAMQVFVKAQVCYVLPLLENEVGP